MYDYLVAETKKVFASLEHVFAGLNLSGKNTNLSLYHI